MGLRTALVMEQHWTDADSADDDASLVVRAKAGHVQAFETLAKRHVRMVLSLIRQRIHDEHAAQDAAQEALLAAYLHLHQLRKPAEFAAWLYRIAVRKAQRPSVRPPVKKTLGQEIAAEREAQLQIERRRAVREAVGELEEPYRVVVTMRFLEGLDATEIAARMGVAQGTIRSWLSRVRPVLRKKLAKHLGM